LGLIKKALLIVKKTDSQKVIEEIRTLCFSICKLDDNPLPN